MRELNSKFDFFNLLNETAFTSPCMIGIDEAGRGPVLGPMVYACAVAPINRLDQLKTLGLADSKQLTEQKREQLLSDMLSNTDWIVGGVHVISPVFISEKMLDRCKTSLNTISHDAAIGLIRAALDAGINLSEAYVDTVGKAEHYQTKLQSLFPKLQVCVESKADDTYPIVSAASIFAKVTRDRLLQMWFAKDGDTVKTPLGSGYPGDPLTKSYLESCLDPIFGFPSIVRASWSTATTLMDRHGVKITWEDDENPEQAAEAKRLARKRDLAKGTCQLSNFFSPSSKPNEKDKRTTIRQPYFARAGLVHVDALI
ncbi:Ribonuclease HII [Fasciola hepatica]|uniref:Ribonuclease n=1 Tax=Fasciola hepatica TaxID=6192 RepID=A0A4E0RDJ0_FASHE|nr:Ribonuclease HII [Fasciola hepatica]